MLFQINKAHHHVIIKILWLRTWEQIEQRMVFINLAGYFSFHRKESTRIRIQAYDTICMNKTWGAWKLAADVLLTGSEKMASYSGFLLETEMSFYFVWCGFFYTRELWMYVDKVGFCDWPLMKHGTKMFTWRLFYVVKIDIFFCIVWQTLFHIISYFISIIYWMVNLIFVKSDLKLMFSKFFQAFKSRTPLLRKKSMYLVRLECISGDET